MNPNAFRIGHAVLTLALGAAAPATAQGGGDIARGAQLFRACAVCHALEPALHLTGPSHAGVWNRPAGRAEGFSRYSEALRGRRASPGMRRRLTPGSPTRRRWSGVRRRSFRDIDDPAARADLVAFLERVGGPGGAEALVAEGVIPPAYLRGQAPEPIADVPDQARVLAVRHCGDGYRIDTADGGVSVHWEQNIRLKIDATETGPRPGEGVILGAGMQGDRWSVIFASVADLERILSESCEIPASKEGGK